MNLKFVRVLFVTVVASATPQIAHADVSSTVTDVTVLVGGMFNVMASFTETGSVTYDHVTIFSSGAGLNDTIDPFHMTVTESLPFNLKISDVSIAPVPPGTYDAELDLISEGDTIDKEPFTITVVTPDANMPISLEVAAVGLLVAVCLRKRGHAATTLFIQ